MSKRSPGGPEAQLRAAFGDAVKKGKEALPGVDRKRIDAKPADKLRCSLHLDEHLQEQHPNARRWDYLLVVQGSTEHAVGVEVHPGTAGEVRAIIEKRNWAIRVLQEHCPRLAIPAADWFWVASGPVYLRKADPQFRLLSQSGIQGPVTHLKLA